MGVDGVEITKQTVLEAVGSPVFCDLLKALPRLPEVRCRIKAI